MRRASIALARAEAQARPPSGIQVLDTLPPEDFGLAVAVDNYVRTGDLVRLERDIEFSLRGTFDHLGGGLEP